MTKRVLLATGLLPLLLVAAVACSKAKNGNGVASVGGSATPSVTPTLSFQEQGLRHARCMREHGVPEADPVVQPNGGVRVGGGFGKGAGGDAALRPAIEACQPYEPRAGP